MMNHLTQSNACSVGDAFANLMGIDDELLKGFMQAQAEELTAQPPVDPKAEQEAKLRRQARHEARRLRERCERCAAGTLTYPMPTHIKNPRRKYLESTTAYRRHLVPASTRCLHEVSSVAPSAMGSSAWWEPRFPEPFQPLMPGMKPKLTTESGTPPVAVSSPWDHPPTRHVTLIPTFTLTNPFGGFPGLNAPRWRCWRRPHVVPPRTSSDTSVHPGHGALDGSWKGS